MNDNVIFKDLVNMIFKDFGFKILSLLFSFIEVNNFLGVSVFKNVIMEILNFKMVGDVFGENGFLNALDFMERKKID